MRIWIHGACHRLNNKFYGNGQPSKQIEVFDYAEALNSTSGSGKITWLVLGVDPAARYHRVEQLTALWGL